MRVGVVPFRRSGAGNVEISFGAQPPKSPGATWHGLWFDYFVLVFLAGQNAAVLTLENDSCLLQSINMRFRCATSIRRKC